MLVYIALQFDARSISAINPIANIAVATKQVAFRLEEVLLERVDTSAERVSQATPGVQCSRVDAVCYQLAHALDELEQKPSRKR